MDVLSYIALGMLIFLIALVIVFIWYLGGMPGRVAASRNHPYAKSIPVGGWASLFLGIVTWPLSLMWAYVNRDSSIDDPESAKDSGDLRQEMSQLASKVEKLSQAVARTLRTDFPGAPHPQWVGPAVFSTGKFLYPLWQATCTHRL